MSCFCVTDEQGLKSFDCTSQLIVIDSGHKITVLIWLVCFSWGLTKFNSFTDKFFIMKLSRWDGSLRKHKPSLPCSISLSNNCVTIKACCKNVNRQHQSSIQQKSNPTIFHQAFLSRPSFVFWQRKVGKMHLLCNRVLFNPSILNFCCLEFHYITTGC